VPLGERGHDLRMADYKNASREGSRSDLDCEKRNIPMKDGDIQSGSMNWPTSWTTESRW
jgi:hypothetical protein